MTEQIDQKHQEDLQRLRGFRLLDDDFLTKCFEGDTASIELASIVWMAMWPVARQAKQDGGLLCNHVRLLMILSDRPCGTPWNQFMG